MATNDWQDEYDAGLKQYSKFAFDKSGNPIDNNQFGLSNKALTTFKTNLFNDPTSEQARMLADQTKSFGSTGDVTSGNAVDLSGSLATANPIDTGTGIGGLLDNANSWIGGHRDLLNAGTGLANTLLSLESAGLNKQYMNEAIRSARGNNDRAEAQYAFHTANRDNFNKRSQLG
jgi:hypothetical protein